MPEPQSYDLHGWTARTPRRRTGLWLRRSLRNNSAFQVSSEASQFFDLLIGGRLLESAALEECAPGSPDQRGVTLFGHESGSSDVSEIVAAALDERDKSVALHNVVRVRPARNYLDACRGEILKPAAHIL